MGPLLQRPLFYEVKFIVISTQTAILILETQNTCDKLNKLKIGCVCFPNLCQLKSMYIGGD